MALVAVPGQRTGEESSTRQNEPQTTTSPAVRVVERANLSLRNALAHDSLAHEPFFSDFFSRMNLFFLVFSLVFASSACCGRPVYSPSRAPSMAERISCLAQKALSGKTKNRPRPTPSRFQGEKWLRPTAGLKRVFTSGPRELVPGGPGDGGQVATWPKMRKTEPNRKRNMMYLCIRYLMYLRNRSMA